MVVTTVSWRRSALVFHSTSNSTRPLRYIDKPDRILWPFIGDQPLNAIYMSDVLKIAYELIEVRSGPSGLHPIYRNGKTPVGTTEAMKEELRAVLGKAFGEDGAQKRQKVLALRERVNRDWAEGGASLRDVSAFLEGV